MILIIPVLLIAFIALSISHEKPVQDESVLQSEVKAIGFAHGGYKVAEASSFPELTPKTFKKVPNESQAVHKRVGITKSTGVGVSKSRLSETSATTSISDSFKVFFAHASSEIPPEQHAPLFQMLECAEKSGFSSLSVSGYASPVGAYQFNKKLAHDRAVAVKELIESRFDTFKVFIREHETEGGFFKEKLVTIQVN